MTIHHATQKRAHRQGLHIEQEHGGYGVYRAKISRSDGDDGPEVHAELLSNAAMYHTTKDAKHAIEQAEIMLAEEGAPNLVLDENQDDDEEQPKSSIVKSKYKEKYVEGNNGDEIATELTAALKTDGKFDLEKYNQVCADNGIDNSNWTDLNNGQKSMNLRNRVRAKWRNGDDINILGHTVPGKTAEEGEDEATD